MRTIYIYEDDEEEEEGEGWMGECEKALGYNRREPFAFSGPLGILGISLQSTENTVSHLQLLLVYTP